MLSLNKVEIWNIIHSEKSNSVYLGTFYDIDIRSAYISSDSMKTAARNKDFMNNGGYNDPLPSYIWC